MLFQDFFTLFFVLKYDSSSAAAEISGLGLKMIDRVCLKEMGIQSLGKQLSILSRVKDLIDKSKSI